MLLSRIKRSSAGCRERREESGRVGRERQKKFSPANSGDRGVDSSALVSPYTLPPRLADSFPNPRIACCKMPVERPAVAPPQRVLIVGAGEFGSTTALTLAEGVYKGQAHLITVLERGAEPPAIDAASSDYNKVRPRVSSSFYGFSLTTLSLTRSFAQTTPIRCTKISRSRRSKSGGHRAGPATSTSAASSSRPTRPIRRPDTSGRATI